MNESFFYLPPNTLTFRRLQQIIVHILDPQNPILVTINNIPLKNPKIDTDNSTVSWSLADNLDIVEASSQKFQICIDHTILPVDFDDLMPISLTKHPPNYSLLPNNTVVFMFAGGFFVRQQDNAPVTLQIDKQSFLPLDRFNSFKKRCGEYAKALSTYAVSSAKFSPLYDEQIRSENETAKMHLNQMKAHQLFIKDTPTIPESYLHSDEANKVDISSGFSSILPSLSTKSTSEPSSLPSLCQMSSSPPCSQVVFPTASYNDPSWIPPAQHTIRMLGQDLEVLFPADDANLLFCGVSENDITVEGRALFQFNVIHFLSVLSEFTGIMYDYRFTMNEGHWKVEDRINACIVKDHEIDQILHRSIQKALIELGPSGDIPGSKVGRLRMIMQRLTE